MLALRSLSWLSLSHGSLASSDDAAAVCGPICTADMDDEEDGADEGAFERSDSFTVKMCTSFVQRVRASALLAEARQGRSLAAAKQSTSGVRRWLTSAVTRSPTVTEPAETPKTPVQRVRYIFGSTPVVKWHKRSLRELQQPLLDAYTGYVLGKCPSAPAEVRVLAEGVRVRYYPAPEAGTVVEFLANFGNMAHYAALRCVVERFNRTVSFVPFGNTPLSSPPEVVPASVVGAPELGDVAGELVSLQNHPPLFVCLIRDSAQRTLRCHTFVCSSAEQAVTIATEVRRVMVNTMTCRKGGNEKGGRWETFLRNLVGKDKGPLGRKVSEKSARPGAGNGGVPRSRSFVHVNRIYRDMLSGCEARHEESEDKAACASEHRGETKEAEIQFTMEELRSKKKCRMTGVTEPEWGRASFLP